MNLGAFSNVINSCKRLFRLEIKHSNTSYVPNMADKNGNDNSESGVVLGILIRISLRLKEIAGSARKAVTATLLGALIGAAGLALGLAGDSPEQKEAKQRLVECLPVLQRMFPETCDANLWAERAGDAASRQDADQTIRFITRALAINPDNADFYNRRGYWEMNLQNDWAAAHRDFADALLRRPSMPFALYNDGIAFARQQKFQEAKKRYTAAIEATSPKTFPEPYRDRGIMDYILGDSKSAVTDLSIAIDNGIADGWAFYFRGKANKNINNAKAGLSDLERAAKVNQSPDIMLDLSATYLEQSLYQKALDTTRLAITTNPGNSGLHNNQGLAFNGLNRPELAKSDFIDATNLDKHNSMAWTNLGDSFAEEKHFDKAIDCYQTALADNHDNAYILRRLSSAQAQAGRGEEALQNATRVTIIDPSNLMGQLLLANSHNLLGRSNLSMAELDALIERNPQSFEAFASRCGLFASRGQYADAAKDCSAALRIKPKDPTALAMRCIMTFAQTINTHDCDDAIRADESGSFVYSARALLNQQAGAMDAALNDARQAVKNNANDAFSQAVLGAVLLANQNYRSAISATDSSIELNPSNAFVYLVRAAAKYKSNDADGARTDLKKMRALANGSITLYSAAGEIEFEFRDDADAAEDLELAISNGETDLDVYLTCGMADYNAGKHEQALRYLDEAVHKYPQSSAPYDVRGLILDLTKNHAAAAADFASAKKLRLVEKNTISK